MILAVLILNEVEYLDDILKGFVDIGIKGATVFDSTGMARVIGSSGDIPVYGLLRRVLHPEYETNKTILTVIEEAQYDMMKKKINDVTGGLSKPDSGILFTLPVLTSEGIGGKND